MLRTKRFIIIFLILCLSGKAFPQKRQVPNLINFDLAPYHFGFLLGVNQMLFTLKTQPGFQNKMYYNTSSSSSLPDINSDSAYLFNMETTPTYGFVIGIIGNLRLGNYFDFRFTPSLTFGERNLHYNIYNYYSNSATPLLLVTSKNIQSTFVEFPLWIRFKGSRMHNMRPYIMAGAKYAIDLASNAKKKEDSSVSYVFINRSDYYAMGGVGFDFYTAYFKFGTEITMSYGLSDILKRDNTIYTQSVDRLSSKIFQVSFTFE